MNNEFTVKDNQDKEIKLMVKNITAQELSDADMYYAGRVAEILRNNKQKLLVRSQVDDYLKESGIWTEKDEKAISDIQNTINEKLNILRKGGISKQSGRNITIEVTKLRSKIVEIMRKRQTFDDSTIESIAERDRKDYIIHTCIVDPDTGEKYWETIDDLKNDKLTDIYAKSSDMVDRVIFDFDPDFENKLPEVKWLKKYKFVDDNLRYIDPNTGEHVDEFGNPLDESEALNALSNIIGDIEPEKPYTEDCVKTKKSTKKKSK
ncbi:MAG: hypothetical protein BAJALOKI3v1_50128 [Promethearchaeota archaeon]|nr:MAG: hypothetical protein BAJALOKI3v1_50128 [Candidatus Lokiarchaeota archaeon]